MMNSENRLPYQPQKIITLFVLAACWIFNAFSSHAQSGDTISYTITFPDAVHHEAAISLSANFNEKRDVTIVMSKTSPGRYAVHHFAKNMYKIQAVLNDDTVSNRLRRIEPDAWQIKDVQGKLQFSYTLFGNQPDGTYAAITEDYAILNMPASLVWIKFIDAPVKLTFQLPDTATWKIATQLPILDSTRHVYYAPDLAYLMDSPVLIGKLTRMNLPEADSTIHIAFQGTISEHEKTELMNTTTAIINEQKSIYGELPAFDYGHYTFLAGYDSGMDDDGMEHRNSTLITAPASEPSNLNVLLSSIAHEFFHVWNMERIRPASLEPFDLTEANVSSELWFGEGFTSYYGDLSLCRAGSISRDEYLGLLGRKISNVLNAPGRHFGSPVYMSEMATYTDRAAAFDATNLHNTFLSYYNYGEAIALALDLHIRTVFKGKSLDDLMKYMWENFGKTERPYTNNDLQLALATVTGNPAFAEEFFNKYIYDNQMPDYTALFDKAGYKFIAKNPGRTSAGPIRLQFEKDRTFLVSEPLFGTPLYETGIAYGDEIILIDGQPVPDYAEYNYIIGTRKVGDDIKIKYRHYDKEKEVGMKLVEDHQFILIPKEQFSIRLKDEETALRQSWLSSKTGKK